MFNVHVYSTHKYYFKYTFSVNILYFLITSGFAVFIFSGCLFCWVFFCYWRQNGLKVSFLKSLNWLSLLEGLLTWIVTLEASKSLFLMYSNTPSRTLQVTQNLQRLNKVEDKVSELEKKERAASNLEVNLQGISEGNFGGGLGFDSVF